MIVVFYLWSWGSYLIMIYLQVTRRSNSRLDDATWLEYQRLGWVIGSIHLLPALRKACFEDCPIACWFGYWKAVCLLMFCIPLLFHWSYRSHSWSSFPFTSKPRRWARVEGDIRCSGPPRKGTQGKSWDCVHVWVLFCVGNYAMFLVIDFCF